MKILCIIRQKLNGVVFYRSVIPHHYMAQAHPDTVIDFKDLLSVMAMGDTELSGYDMVHSSYSECDPKIVRRVMGLGVKFVVDADDYWKLDRFHELYEHYELEDRPGIITTILEISDAVTCTTPLLADKVRPFNPNIGIFNNTLMEDDYINPRKNQVPYAAWIGGNNHTADLMEIQHLQKGFFIPTFIPEMYRSVFRDRFLYYPGKTVPEYLDLYNQFEIILCPLRSGKFNQYKSPLKVMEAGFFSKSIIVPDVEPFSPHLKHKENCLVVKKKSQWAKWIKLLSKDAEMRKELGKNLNAYVEKNFDLDEITERRYQFYRSVCGLEDETENTPLA